MRLIAVVLPLVLAQAVSAGIFIAGYSNFPCSNPVGNVTITQNNVCTTFSSRWFGIQVAGGGSQSCFLRVFRDLGCGQFMNQIGPVSDLNLGSCIGPGTGGIVEGAESALMVGCPA